MLSLFVSLFFLSPSVHADLYTIPAGDHYATPYKEALFWGKRMDIAVSFDESAMYEFTGDSAVDNQDVNKLYGFADCKGLHERNSARLGWRFLRGQLEILGFTHRGGKFYSQYITAIQMNQTYRSSISLSPDRKQYIYEFNGVKVSMERGCEDDSAIGYKLYPYFGGNQVAPHDVSINVEEVDQTGPATIGLPFPNPAVNYKVNFKANAFEAVQVYLKLYDMSGRTVWNSPKVSMPAYEETTLQYELPHSLASGVYLALPVTVQGDGTELPAAIANQTTQKVHKILVIH